MAKPADIDIQQGAAPAVDAAASDSGRVAKDLFSGAVGGIAQVLIGQPFDIVKVRLQTTTKYSSALDCATQTLKNEGPLAFYKGTLTPLIGIGACVSVQFGAFHWARRTLESSNSHSTNQPSTLSYPQFYLAGAFAGLANTPLSTPIEHIRIRLQTQPHGSSRLYSGPVDCIRKITAQAGLLKGVYRGFTVTALREATAYGAWFLTFEYLMNSDAARHGIARKEISTGKIALYGGLAGEALWIASYPFDVVKSRMQTDPFGAGSGVGSGAGAGAVGDASMRGAFARTWAQGGVGAFWKGIGPTLLRAMPVSAGTFAVVELTMRALG